MSPRDDMMYEIRESVLLPDRMSSHGKDGGFSAFASYCHYNQCCKMRRHTVLALCFRCVTSASLS